MTAKQKRKWLHKCATSSLAAQAVFTSVTLLQELERRGRADAREYAMKTDGNKAPAGYRKKFKRGVKLVKIGGAR